MKAAVLYAPGDIKIQDIDIPKPTKQDVLIKVKACGVCGTDNALYQGEYPGNYPVVVGHEFSGDVVEVEIEGIGKFTSKVVADAPEDR